MTRAGRLAASVVWCIAVTFGPALTLAQRSNDDLSNESLEQLTHIHIRVSSFARKDEELWTTPAAVSVITKVDIARSSASSIPKVLRMVPGMQVAQINASSWAISARGFNSDYADKLLVLIDGRTVSSEAISGAQWDQIDLPLQNIERIEVIRGPGAAMWGTNAVNGFINIITKKSRNTIGLDVSDNVSRIGETADIRYGVPLGQRVQYRIFSSYIDRSPLDTAEGIRAFDGERTIRGGGRLDWQSSPSDWITTSGDVYGGHINQQIEPDITLEVGPHQQEKGPLAGGHVLGLWEHTSQRGEMALQVYYDEQSRHELATHSRTRTLDVDYQDHLPLGMSNDLVWGAELRFTGDRMIAQVHVITLPDCKNKLVDGFLQDEITISSQKLILTLGSKIQYGTLAGFQIQPSVRILTATGENQSLWTALSRAAVAPSLQDRDIKLSLKVGVENNMPVFAELRGNPEFKPETVVAYELGYRRRICRALTLEIATYFNNNNRIQSVAAGSPSFAPLPSPHIEVALWYTNGFRARTTGMEATTSWKPLPSLSFQASYTWMQAHTTQTEPRLDPNLARKVGHSLEFEVGGTNLLTPRHFEFPGGTSFIVPFQVPRSAFVKATWTF